MSGDSVPKTLIGSCMDRRLNHMIDSMCSENKAHGNVVVVRSAGSTMRGLKETIDDIVESGEIERIYFYTHTDCGACQFVYEATRNHLDLSNRLGVALVNYIAEPGKKFSSGADVEAENIALLRNALEEYQRRGIEVRVEEVNMNTLNVPKEAWSENMTLVVGKPFSGSFRLLASKLGLSPWTMFCINANRIADVIPDIDVAILALKIKKIKILSTAHNEILWAEEQLKILRLMDFMRTGDVIAEVVKLD